MYSEKSPEAIDLSHHLSDVSRARVVSPLKGLQKYMTKPGLIMMAGGTPSPEYFPFSTVSGETLIPDSFPLTTQSSSSFSWFWKLFGAGASKKEKTTSFTINKWPTHTGDLNLATALQYSPATGLAALQKILHEFSEKVYQPGYKNFTTLIDAGNTDGWGKAALTLLNQGEGVLCSQWTYPSALAGIRPWGIKTVPIAMDGQGMRSDSLRETLASWDDTERGFKRPHVMYVVPVGQNPTGATMEAQRKKEIYDICVEFDVIIVEDDPYYFLQQSPYVPKDQRADEDAFSRTSTEEKFIAQLAPSFLKFDYQGRVIRLDTFSKTIAPGCRLGWFTCSPQFAERLERAGETSTQAPCGFAQVMVTSLLLNWHYEGYIRWLRALRLQYQQRRDAFIDALADAFQLDMAIEMNGHRKGSLVYHASLKPERQFSEKSSMRYSKPLFSFVPPSSGMFVWLKLHLEDHPSYTAVGYKPLELKLWSALADHGVVFGFGQGSMFSASEVTDETKGDGHFRISFSMTDHDAMKKAASTFALVFREFMKDQ
ncbi:PLP-dependent transferase [Guyanagaster necrorhizus]|uniref:PLP-dependent transferase n=1 Tax=Guyanagaster necrorhizus TaxID=856835 RepID=A0A9P7VZW4_9AGAR|nr:PLP-dependent transferase [Guyanagaster necrorhizus MCA 3950]KAG7449369.1 PLP-dependent transferase [Guyanagaster necrorhizus MCA 3950]